MISHSPSTVTSAAVQSHSPTTLRDFHPAIRAAATSPRGFSSPAAAASASAPQPPQRPPLVHRQGSSDESANTTNTTSSTQTARSGVSFQTSDTSITQPSASSGSAGSLSRKARASSTSSHPLCPESTSPRVVFGPGTVSRLPTELGRLRLVSPLIVSSPSRIALARRIQALIPNLNSRILDSAVANVPQRVVDNAVARITGQDCVISIGGGSAVGLAKAIGVRKSIPHICIPTTYSGSEVGPFLAGESRKSSDARQAEADEAKVMPAVIIYDEELTASPPKRFSAPSAGTAASQVGDVSSRRSSRDDTAQWSYIHLPGV